jgi:hypothetical protein
MLYIINSLEDPLIQYLKDDPVRPEIPAEFRVSGTTEIFALVKENKPSAIVCVAYMDFVPKDCNELFTTPNSPSVAVFYTIWSYDPGAGCELIRAARKELPKRKPEIKKFVTLSPQNEMAKKFHLKNGASIFRDNPESVNYEYS